MCSAEKTSWEKSPGAGGRVTAVDGGTAADDSLFFF